MPDELRESRPFTAKQGQYLAYIYYYTKIHGRPPAESDLQRYCRVTPPVVHQMIKTLEARGWIHRQPGAARSIRASVDERAAAGSRIAVRPPSTQVQQLPETFSGERPAAGDIAGKLVLVEDLPDRRQEPGKFVRKRGVFA